MIMCARRQRLLAAALGGLLYGAAGCDAALKRFDFTVHSASRSPDGFEREVYLVNGQQPGPLIDVEEGDDVEVHVKNELMVDTAIHWHGLMQRGTPDMDGVPGVTQKPIPPGGNMTYRFSTKGEYGFYWYHSHFKAYYNDAIRGPLLIRPAASRQRPFDKIAGGKPDQMSALLAAEKDANNILLNDWTHELSDVISARYMQTGAAPSCVDSILANGLGRVQCLPQSILDAGPGLGIRSQSGSPNQDVAAGFAHKNIFEGLDMHDMTIHPSPTLPRTAASATATPYAAVVQTEKTSGLGPRGCTKPMMFKPGFDQASLPAETCANTTSPLLVVPADQKNGWLALNLVNSGAVSALSVSLDAHSMFVYATDGEYTQPQEVKVLHMELGQRYSVMVKLDQKPASYFLRFATFPSGDMQQVLEGKAIVSYTTKSSTEAEGNVLDDEASVWMYVNGSAKAGAARLKAQDLSPFDQRDFPSGRTADKTMSFTINQTDATTWVLDHDAFKEPDVPILKGAASPAWNASTTIQLPLNSTVDVIFNIANQSMDVMGHPIHLHGHKFWVLGSGEGSFPYDAIRDAPEGMLNLRNPPLRDTTGVPAQGWTVMRFVTDNPGAWILHCHLQWHIASGMAVVFVEGGEKLPSLLEGQAAAAAATNASGQRRSASLSRITLFCVFVGVVVAATVG